MEGYYIALFICVFSLLSATSQYLHSRSLQRTIDRQQDTIQKLINREPVTYAETGTKPQNKPTERYSAWSGQMVDMNEEESRS